MDFRALFEDDFKAEVLSLDQCFSVLAKHLWKIKIFEKSRESVLVKAFCVSEKGEKIILAKTKIYNFMLLQKFKKSNFLFFDHLQQLISKGTVELNQFAQELKRTLEEYDLSLEEAESTISSVFEVLDGKIKISSVLEFYERKMFFKIKLFDFLLVVLDVLQNIYDKIESGIVFRYNRKDRKKEGILFFNSFSDLIGEILGKDEQAWKVSQYWKFNLK